MNLNVYVYLFFQEFIRVGYYVSNEYSDPELQETPPETPNFDKLTRNILASNPRVTKFKINWDDPSKVRKIDFIQYTLPFFFWHLFIIINFPPYFFQPNENGETSENAANSNAMEENSNSSSTNSHFDENKPPAGDPNALPPTKDPMFASPLKSGLPPRIPSLVQENNSTNDGMDIE